MVRRPGDDRSCHCTGKTKGGQGELEGTLLHLSLCRNRRACRLVTIAKRTKLLGSIHIVQQIDRVSWWPMPRIFEVKRDNEE